MTATTTASSTDDPRPSSDRQGPPAHADHGRSAAAPDRDRSAAPRDTGNAAPTGDEDTTGDEDATADDTGDGTTSSDAGAGSSTPVGPLLAATPAPGAAAPAVTVLGPAPTSPGPDRTTPRIVGPATILVPLDGDVSRALDALAQRTRTSLGGLAGDGLPARDLGVPAALLALLGAYLAGLRWLDRGGLPMTRLEDGQGDDVQLVL